ncbi:MAG TPA: magnesium/cobalt transporter CorA [Actinomycetales bacterium]|nr:magnesium/cobalt transporter CorA [Actinomycetales bacterium]
MIVDVATYTGGRRYGCSDFSTELATRRDAGEGFIWIGLKDPTSEEFARVRVELGLHHLAAEDAVKGHQRPKLEQYQHSLFVVLKTLRYIEATSDVETGEIMLFVGDRFVVTVRRGELHPLADVRRRLEEQPAMLAHGPAVVLHAVMDAVVDTYTAIDAELQADLDDIEIEVFAGDRRADAARIYALKREVLEFRRAAGPLVEPARRLAEDELRFVPPETRPFFRDVHDHVLRVEEHVGSYDRLLSDVLSAHLAQVSVQQNSDMRRISAWVAIAAVPTMVAGIYGMNFDHMPELRWEYGYLAVLVVLAVACTGLYRAFKRSGWL